MSIKVLLVICALLETLIAVLLIALLVQRRRHNRLLQASSGPATAAAGPESQVEPESQPEELSPNAFIARVEEIINENLADSTFSVEALAEKMYVSRSGIYAKVKQLTGSSPNRMILKARFEKAIELMADSSITLAQISEQTGFASASYFSKSFTHAFGQSPNRWRESHFRT